MDKNSGCLTKSLLEMPEEGSYVVYSRGVAKCIWYNDKRLWSGGYNLSCSKLLRRRQWRRCHPLVRRRGRDVHCILGVLRKSSHTQCRS